MTLQHDFLIESETTPSKPLNKNWSGGHFVLWLERVNDYSTHNCCSRQSLSESCVSNTFVFVF